MDTIEEFQSLLRELFQFETSDLDFGIYRILNYKRERIKKFIEKDLVNRVEYAFTKHKDERLTDINQRFEEAKQELIDTAKKLGKEPLAPTGNLKDEFKESELGRKYLSLKVQKEEAETIDEIKLQVFNDLYNFFSRFYEEGDFVPQYRYSIKGHKYAIPYNGEEVKLYWANNEQYYTKTGLLFRDYIFQINPPLVEGPGVFKVLFRTVSAKEELGSNKATKERFFVLDDENLVDSEGNKTLIIRFQYRELIEKEVKYYNIEGGSNTSKQEKINQKCYEEILNSPRIEGLGVFIKNVLTKEYKHTPSANADTPLKEGKNKKPLLLYQISRFTAKNTKDYFIHKNLKKFLSEQLDYFIKAEVLNIETLEKERFLDKHITRAKVVREIGEDIIDFLSQIEDFQKRLWEKKKFVLRTEYVITTDRVPEEFYDEIWKNKEQKKEWKELGFDTSFLSLRANAKQSLKDLKLPIDTKYFSEDFKLSLLEKITSSSVVASDSEATSLDDLLDGILIKSENWQALNLLLSKYKESIKTIYIDPPYNTGSDGFLYRDRYQHSSWLTMMENRLSLARELMREDGTIFISIDDNELKNLKNMSHSLGYFMISNFIRKSGIAPRQDVKFIATEHDYVLCLAKNIEKVSINKKLAELSEGYPYEDKFLSERGRFTLNKLDRGSIHYSESLDYPITVIKGTTIDVMEGNSIKRIILNEDIKLWPGGDPKDRQWTWRWSKDKLEWGMENKMIVFRKVSSGWSIYFKQYQFIDNNLKPIERENPYRSLLLDFTNEIGNKEIKNLFGSLTFTSFPKPVPLTHHLLKIGADKKSYVLDFFAGSGTTAHAVMKLNKEDGGKRKFILVEMADYFDTVIIPRIKEVAYSFNWKNGKPQDTDGIGGFFKYQILEQYEDTLDNIELKENIKAQELFKDEYLLKYFLDYETRESLYLLNIKKLKNPFAYKLKVNLSEVGEPQEMVVDISETFNYLLGLKVKKVKARDCFIANAPRNDKERKYLFILGEKEGKDYAIVWREYNDKWEDEDFKKDKEFIIKGLSEWKPYIVYVNGQSVLTPKIGDGGAEIRYIEPEFKRLMGG